MNRHLKMLLYDFSLNVCVCVCVCMEMPALLQKWLHSMHSVSLCACPGLCIHCCNRVACAICRISSLIARLYCLPSQVSIKIQSVRYWSLNHTLTCLEGHGVLRPSLVNTGQDRLCSNVVLQVGAWRGLAGELYTPQRRLAIL